MAVVEFGKTWKPYSVVFESSEGKFCFEIYAFSFDHAESQLEAIRNTAVVDGEIQKRAVG